MFHELKKDQRNLIDKYVQVLVNRKTRSSPVCIYSGLLSYKSELHLYYEPNWLSNPYKTVKYHASIIDMNVNNCKTLRT